MNKIKNPKELQLNDEFYIVRQSPMDDNNILGPSSVIKHTFVDIQRTVRVEWENEKNEMKVLIKAKGIEKPFIAPAEYDNSELRTEDVITDRTAAFDLAKKYAQKEKDKAEHLVSEAKKVLDGVEQNIKILQDNNSSFVKETTFFSTKKGKTASFSERMEETVAKENAKSAKENVQD